MYINTDRPHTTKINNYNERELRDLQGACIYQHSVCKDGKRSRVRQCVLVSESYATDIDH